MLSNYILTDEPDLEMPLWSPASTVHVLASFSEVCVIHIFASTWPIAMVPNVNSSCRKDYGTGFMALYPSIGCSCFDVSNIQILSEAAHGQLQCWGFFFFNMEILSRLLLVK